MTAAIAAGRRHLPRGYTDLARQVVIWFGFLLAYQIARGVADRDPTRAFANGWKVIDWEQRLAGLGELTLQGWTQSSHFLAELVSWTYWNSEFTVIGLALLWVYLRRNEAFTRFRNTILLANVLGLVGYVLLPTAPPRFFTSIGFIDTLNEFGGLNHGSGRLALARGGGARFLRDPRRAPLLLGRRRCLCDRVDSRHPRRRARPGGRQDDAVRVVPRFDHRPRRRRRDARGDRADLLPP